jgi:cell fate (sporulation/competence/biofilm development) regulator YlbF (YheA/YmcA/DUF963 family)
MNLQDSNKHNKKEHSYTFTLNEPQLQIIFNAIEHYASNTLSDLIKYAEREEGDKGRS